MSDNKQWRYHASRSVEFEIPCPFCKTKIKHNTRNGCTSKFQDHIVLQHLDQAFASIMTGGEDAAYVKRRIIDHFVRDLGRWLPKKKNDDSAF